MKPIRALFALALVAAFALPAAAKTFPHQEGQVEITAPDDWKDEAKENTLSLTSPDGAVGLSFMMLETGESDKAGEIVDKELEKALGAPIEWDKEEPAEEKINGMDCWYWVGAAKPEKGDGVVVLAWVINTPSDKELLCYCGIAASAMEKNQAALEKIVDSIKPLGGEKKDEKKEEKKEEKSEEGEKEE